MKIKELLLSNALLIGMFYSHAQSTSNTFPTTGNASLGTANYLTSGRMYFHGYSADPQNDNNRGTLANNLYWDYTLPGWTTSTLSTNDFSVLRFENNGDLGFYTKPNESGLTSPLTYTDITPYKRMVIKNNGYVGINVADPGARLEVAGAIRSSGFSSTSGYFEATNVQNGNVYFTTNTISGNGFLKLNRLDGSTVIYLNSFGASYFTGGNLLIGKTSQANTSYKLDVDGNVRADKVVVNTSGADFVFDPSYNLMPLDEVENFIKSNHHLPQIAPASAMQTNGIDIGNNQTKLLQKTEELTLYLIEQDKKIKQLTEQNKQLKEQVSQFDEMKIIIARLQQAIEKLQNNRQTTQTNHK